MVAKKKPDQDVVQEKTAREIARGKLLAAGILSTKRRAPKGTVALTPEEILELGRLAEGSPTIQELIDADRGTY